MKHKLNKILSALLTVLLCVGSFAFAAPPARAADTASGTCGDSLLWNLSNGTLTISGTGAMYHYDEFSPAPWAAYASRIQTVTVQQGVTSVGDMAFYHCTALTSVQLAGSVTSLGQISFAGCSALRTVIMPGVVTVGRGCFYDCWALVNLLLPETLQTIEPEAFYRCKSLAGVTVPVGVKSVGSSAFAHCENLTYARVDAPISVLSKWVFYGCTSLSQLYLPDTIQTVEQGAVEQCPELYYVDCGAPQEVKQTIQQQLDSTPPAGIDYSQDKTVTFEQTPGASITTTDTTTFDTGVPGSGYSQDSRIDATVTDPSGWQDIANGVPQGSTVDVELPGASVLDEDSLHGLASGNINVNIHTSQNVDWQVVMGDQNDDTLDGEQDLSVSMTGNTSEKFTDTIGDTESYLITLGDTTLNSTILFPLGGENSRRTATLYRVNGSKLEKLSSVVVDNAGKAAFSLAGTKAGEYILALDVQSIDPQEVTIPKALSEEYDITYGATLTDAYGNQYVLTGRVNKLGISAGTLGLIVLGVLLVSTLLVGVVMVIWNKQRQRSFTPPHRG